MTSILTAKCYCALTHFTISIPTPSLPLPTHLCHCSFCRTYTGALAVFHAQLPLGTSPLFIAPSLRGCTTAYVHGPSAEIEALFCRRCGCHVATHALPSAKREQEWTVATSIFDAAATVEYDDSGNEVGGIQTRQLRRLFQITRHIFTLSAKDGGLADIIPTVGGRPLECWDPPPDDPRAGIIPTYPIRDRNGSERVLVQCHCGGVSYTLGRPSLDGQSGKWKAQLDVCKDCRLQTGAHVQPWASIHVSALWPPPFNTPGTLREFSSSTSVVRYFCGNCGATVFARKKPRRGSVAIKRHSAERGEEEVVSLAVGVIRAPEGPLAEEWLEWSSEVAYEASGRRFDAEFVDALIEGIKMHRIGQSTSNIPAS